MRFIRRHFFLLFVGIVVMLAEWNFKVYPQNLESLMSAVLTLSATLTAIFVGFVSIVLSLRKNVIFHALDLDLSMLENLMLGTFAYLALSFESLLGFFISSSMGSFRIFMTIWFVTLSLAFGVTISLLKYLAYILHGQWKKRQENKDIYPDKKD